MALRFTCYKQLILFNEGTLWSIWINIVRHSILSIINVMKKKKKKKTLLNQILN